MQSRKLTRLIPVLLACVAAWGSPASAQQMEKIKLVISFLGAWDSSQASYCKERGEFARAGLDVEVINTRGGSENIQAVIAGGADIGYGVGVNAVFAAYAQGAKIKLISSEFTGQNDTYFYVPTASPIKSINDMNGKTIAFPRPGGATEALVLSLIDERKLNLKPVATGGIDATYTMVMTNQVDVGYSVPPAVLPAVEKGEVRIVFSGDEVISQKVLTTSVTIARADFLKNKRAVVAKFMETLDKCYAQAYANFDESAKWYAELNKVDLSIAKRALRFYDRSILSFGPVRGFETVLKQAIDGKFIKSMSPAQIQDLVDIVYTSPM